MTNISASRNGQSITAGLTSAATALVGTAADLSRDQDILLWNPGPSMVHVRTGDASVVATTLSAPLPPGALWAYRKGEGTHIATLAVGAAQAILVLVGQGS